MANDSSPWFAAPPLAATDASVIAAPAGRLWFHLDDVLPLAGHAAHAPRHSVTRAQLHANAPLLPALAWTGEHGTDTLISNGLPGWYDADGHPHTAAARGWIRRPGVTAGDPQDRCATTTRSGYLPLRTFGTAGFHVIDWLRHAATGGAHWVSLDISRPRPVISPDRLDVSDQHDNRYPTDITWIPATVACVPHTGSGRYPALVAAGHLATSGGEITRFDRATIDTMIADLDTSRAVTGDDGGWQTALRWVGNRLHVFADHHSGSIPERRRNDVVGPDRDGRYPLGALLWTWLRTDLA